MRRASSLVAALILLPTLATPARAQTPIVLTAMIQCAPRVDHGIIAGIISRETSTSPYQPITANASQLWQINDNTLQRSATFADYPTAVRITSDLVYHLHHTVAIGIGQILSDNITAYKVSIADAFLPCTNLSLAQQVLGWAYVYAIRTLNVPPGLSATHTALQIYYAGLRNDRWRYPDAVAYADDVMQRAAEFNSYAARPAPTLATLPMPEHPWPTGANSIPIADAPRSVQRPQPSPAHVANARAIRDAAVEQRRLNALFQQ